MSPEVALLVRAALLGLVVLAVERFGKRRQAKRTEQAEAERTVIRLPATRRPDKPFAGRPLQVTVHPRTNASTASAQAKSGQANSGAAKIVQLEPTPAMTPASKLYDGHVTEKRAA